MMQYITLLNVSIVFIIFSVILAILVYHEHINGAVVLFLITTIPLIAFPFLWTLSIYRRQEKKRQDVMKGKWK
jgi:O-antigen/teichoic acid export membrane protein|tara:strand:+ start:277 stop:495 length:219 start_codon:yes stop_codon:yes gene_type:complete